MALVHQSMISSWIRCPAAVMYSNQGLPRKQLSATAYGSVIHYALEVFERLKHTEGVAYADAVEACIDTFTHYWHPTNIAVVCEPVDVWIPRQGYNDLRTRGIEVLRSYCELMRFDDHELLATEYSFCVPIIGTWDEDLGEPHILGGTIDRLAVRRFARKPALCIDDFKSGKEYKFLRQNLQFSAYAYATTRPEFWTGWDGEDGFGHERGLQLYTRFQDHSRRGTWINMRTVKFQDAGWRGPEDYRRFALAVEQIVASMKADIYPMSLSGEACQYCEFKSVCAGPGVPANDHGAPQ